MKHRRKNLKKIFVEHWIYGNDRAGASLGFFIEISISSRFNSIDDIRFLDSHDLG